MKRMLILATAATVVGCQQLQLWSEQAKYNRKHEEWCLRDYNSHVENLSSGVAKLHQSLPKAVRAEWQWIYDCDACDDSCYRRRLNSVATNLRKSSLCWDRPRPCRLYHKAPS